MHIAFVTRAYWPALGGQENYLRHLATGLAERHAVTVLAQTSSSVSAADGRLAGLLRQYPSFSPYVDGAVSVRQVRIRATRCLWLTPSALMVVRPFSRYAYATPAQAALAVLHSKAVGPLLRTELASADVVHMWGGGLLGASTLRAARILGKPTVMTPFAHAGQHGDDSFSASCYRNADRVVGLLSSDAALYERLGVRRDRLRVLPVCSPGIADEVADIRARHGVRGPLVLFLAVRRAYKGLDLLLGALSTLAASAPDVTVAIAGPGAEVTGEYPVRVIDLGQPDDSTLAAWLQAADVLCLPSMHEIFPVSFLEAWSARTAVVTSDIPPLQELMTRSAGGLAVRRDATSVGAALGALLTDPALCLRFAKSGHDWWRAHATPARVVARQEAIYEGVVGGPGRHAAENDDAFGPVSADET